MTEEPDAGREGGKGKRVPRFTGLDLPGLQQWRMRRGISQQELAKMVGVPLQYILRIEQGKRGCNPERTRELGALL